MKMSEKVDVKSIQAIVRFRQSFGKFSGESQGIIDELSSKLGKDDTYVKKRVSDWKKDLEESNKIVAQAKKALDLCRSRQSRNGQCNCQRELEVYKKALAKKRKSETNLRKARNSLQQIETARNNYNKIRSINGRIQDIVNKASSKLGAHLRSLSKYKEMSQYHNSLNKGHDFEKWASTFIFGQSNRLVVDGGYNTHLDEIDDPDGIGITKNRRISDIYINDEGEIWELKSGYKGGGINRDQLYEYSLMEEAGYIYVKGEDDKGIRKNVTSINYLFDSLEGAQSNATHLSGLANIWYVDDHGDISLFLD